MNLHKQIQSNGSKITQLRLRILETCAFRDEGPREMAEWRQACSEFHEHYQELAFPGGVFDARDRMRAGDEQSIEYAIAFLEVRPYFFRSGYMYQEYMRVLRNCPLSDSQRRRYDEIRARYQIYRETRRRFP